MVNKEATKKYPFLDLENGVYHYSKEISMVFLYQGETFINYYRTASDFYWKLMAVFGKNFKNHTKVIEIVRGVYDEIKTKVHKSFELEFGHKLKLLDENIKFSMPVYEQFIIENQNEINKYSLNFIESELLKINDTNSKLIFLVNLLSDYKKYRLKLKIPPFPIKELFDIKDFDLFEENANIEIQRLEKIIKLSGSGTIGNVQREENRGSDEKTYNSVLRFNSKYINTICENIEFLFDEKDRRFLKALLEGNEIPVKLLFLKSGNQLADIFKRLFHLNVVILEGFKEDLEDWLLKNFRYRDQTKKGRIADFNKSYLVKQISGKVDPCKNPIFNIFIDSSQNLCFETLSSKQRRTIY